MFRAKFLDGLAQAREQGRLPSAADDAAWRALLRALRRHDWVVYAKQPLGGPSQVLEYLARYTHRVTISNEQLADMADGTVAFRVRDNAHPGNKRIRHYGMLASVHKHAQLARCRQALQMPEPDAAVIETVDAFFRRVTGRELACCPQCEQPAMRLLEVIAPSRRRACATGPP